MLIVKLKNSVELFWDTLDTEEKRMVVYALAWIVGSALLTIRRAQREAFKRAVVDEVLAEGTADGSRS